MNSSVVYLKHALTPQNREVAEFCGQSIAELDPAWSRPYIALVDGQPVLRADWATTVLFEGRVLVFVDVAAIPQGGGGGSDPLRTVMMLAVIVAAVVVPQTAFMQGVFADLAFGGIGVTTGVMGSVVSGAILLGGSMLVNAIAPPATQSISNNATTLEAASPTYNIQAQGNTARIEGAIPEQFGRHMSYPDYAAMPYQEFSGNEQYVYALLCLGRGEYDIEGVFVEDTPVANFSDITYEVVAPNGTLTLFPANVTSSIEVAGADLLTGVTVGPYVANAAETTCNFLGVDFIATRGLYYAQDDGSLAAVSISFVVEARSIDDNGTATGSWTTLGTHTYTAATTTAQRYTEKYAVAIGRYEVRVTRTSAKSTDTRTGNDLVWAGLRAYLNDVRQYGDVTLIALRMKATSQLSGQSSRKIKIISTRKLPIYNGSTWSAPTATTSIAWALAYCCHQIGLTDAQIDLATLRSLDATWTARGDQCNGRLDGFVSFWDAVTKIAMAGRAKPFMQGGVMRFFRDQAATIPVALFSMCNILKGSLSIDYLMPTTDTADAIDVGYFDAVPWAQRRVRSILPGSTAAKPAKVELSYVTSRQQAYREGMYQAGCNRYRRRIISFTTEMEGFIPSFGDLAIVQHDMPAWGQAGECVAWNAAALTLTVSEHLTWTTGQAHYLGLRRPDGSVCGPIAVTRGAADNILILASMPDCTPYTGGAYERTHCAFGWGATWGQRVRILSVKPKGLYAVDIQAVNEDDNVHTAETGLIAPVAQTSQLPSGNTAPAVIGLTATAMPSDSSVMLLSWQSSAWAEHYLLEASGDAANWTRIGETSTSNYTAKAIYGTATIIRVAAVGLRQGAWATVAYADIVQSAWNTSLSGFAATANKTMVDLSWDPSGDWNIAGYELRFGSSWDTGTVIVTGHKSSSISWQPSVSGSLQFWLRAIDRWGVYSLTSATAMLAIDAPTVSGLSQQVIDNNVLLSWTATAGTFAIDHAEVRRGMDWTTATVVGILSSTFTAIFETVSGTYKYWVALVDSAGLYGTPVGVYAVVSQPPDYVLHDQRPLDWTGTCLNCSLDAGVFYAPVAAETYQDHFDSNAWLSPQAQVDAGYPYYLQPGTATGSYVETIDYEAIIPSTMVTLTLTRETIVGTVTVVPTLEISLDGQTWTTHAGVYACYANTFRYVRVTLNFATADHGFMVITDSLVRLDVKQKTVQGSVAAAASDSGGTAIDITGRFIDVQSIIVSAQSAVPVWAVYDFVDVPNPTTFKVLIFNTVGTRVSGTVSYTVKGV